MVCGTGRDPQTGLLDFNQRALTARRVAVRRKDVGVGNAVLEVIDVDDMLSGPTRPVDLIDAIADRRHVDINGRGILAIGRREDHLPGRLEIEPELLIAEIHIIGLAGCDELGIACDRHGMEVGLLREGQASRQRERQRGKDFRNCVVLHFVTFE